VSDERIYVLDANVFIEAKNRYYAFDIVPAFWESLILHASTGRIKTIDRIKRQLEEGNDELAEWVQGGRIDSAVVESGQLDVIQSFQEMISWVQSNVQFMDAAKATFAGDADGWLIAYAKAKGPDHIIVTQETLHPEARSKVPIPNVCRQFGVTYVDTFQMLRELGVRFNA